VILIRPAGPKSFSSLSLSAGAQVIFSGLVERDEVCVLI
jgi:hypothetical protein